MRDWKQALKKFADNRQEEILLAKGLEELKKKQEAKNQEEKKIEEVKQEQKRKNTL
ncbi:MULTISPECIES: hypothetical protein [Ralstonia]|uniref:hypothetical protein n=1 Tax=Ralstonia mannitolilytica TaxID=105219 RepID=UPI001C93E3B3|nr:hypothetical protein [Ralstonia mannitolilytica]MBY4720422.1 hypothetical protein [Ralstonia mannitolilytica]